MEFTLDEAVQRLKAEILAPDWCLGERRALGLLQALTVVESRHRQRRVLLCLGGMARAAVAYLRSRGEAAPPEVLDFLKQALAHLVALLEEEEVETVRETEVFHKLHDRFQRLKAKLAAGAGN